LALELILSTLAAGAVAAAIDHRATRREHVSEAAYPPTGQLIDIDGRAVHAHVEGSGPDLVLIHGASGSTRDFTFSLVKALAPRYRVVAFDRPGLGWSDDIGPDGTSPMAQASILRAAADRLGVRRPIVLGYSYGGAVALAWALGDRASVAALVILAGATMPWTGGLGTWYALTSTALGRAAVIPLVTAFVPTVKSEAIINGIFAPDPVPEGYAGYLGAGLTLRRAVLSANARQVNALKAHVTAMARQYGELDLPVEILHGDNDPTVPHLIHALPLARILPDAAVTLLPGVGHMPHHADPGAVIAAIDRAGARAGLR
jgi:pimeloyl-ACP methyl ester carboxylesterase